MQKSGINPFASSSRSASNTIIPTYFHYLIPATRSNKNLCRLLLSSTALNFPSPVFINWAAEEDADPYKVHMQKVNSILAYLDSFGQARHNDLVFIVDGYDVWLQLPPSVVIKRYYDIIDAANERLRQRLGAAAMKKHNIHQSIVFGPDKICWPEDLKRFACWAVADSILPRWAFGPETDSGKWRHLNRPRWLNSGTIVGPLGDIRDLFQATSNLIAANYTVDSDQFYFSDIFGIQEHARRLVAGDMPADKMQYRWHTDGWNGEGHMEWVQLLEPSLNHGQRTEYHVTIDYESQLFQTVAYYNHFLSWKLFDVESGQAHNSSEAAGEDAATLLPLDILSAPQPFALQGNREPALLNDNSPAPPSNLSWQDLALGFNTASKHIFAAIHFTPPKHYRDLWWNRMWFAPYAETIIRNARITHSKPYLTTRDGREWWPYLSWDEANHTHSHAESRAGGGYSDKGQWLGWTELCGQHEDGVFHNVMEQDDVPFPDWRENSIDYISEHGSSRFGQAELDDKTVETGAVAVWSPSAAMAAEDALWRLPPGPSHDLGAVP